MARLLASWELGLRYGHVANLAPLAAMLRTRGHSVALAARNPATALARGGGAFDGLLQAPLYSGHKPAGETIAYGQVVAAGGFVDTASVTALVREWLAVFEAQAPDALIVEHAPMSLLAAHVAGLPAVRVGASFAAPHAEDVSASLQPWKDIPPAELAAAGRVSDQMIRDVSRAFGAPPLEGLAELAGRAPGFTLSWPEIDHYGAAERVYYGPLAGIMEDGYPAWPEYRGPRILVYLPFGIPAASRLVEALASLGWPTIWHAEGPGRAALPANILHSVTPVDLAALGAEADLFVGRGGHGAGCAMLRAGVPQLLFPDTLESLLVTYRLRRAGVAASQSGSADRNAVITALEQAATSENLRNRAARQSARYAAYDPRRAAEILAEDVISALG